MTITEIVSNIDRRLADVHAEVAHLEGARVALLNGSPPARFGGPAASATRWHVITDEDRVAARAAEFNAQSRRRRARND